MFKIKGFKDNMKAKFSVYMYRISHGEQKQVAHYFANITPYVVIFINAMLLCYESYSIYKLLKRLKKKKYF